MNKITTGSPQTDKSLVSLLLGFFGVTAGFLLLPRTAKFVVRRFITGIASEIVAVVVTGLLTEKLVGYLADHNDSERLPEPPRHR